MSAVVNTYRKLIKSGNTFIEVIHNLWEASHVSYDDPRTPQLVDNVQDALDYLITGFTPTGGGGSEIDFGDRMNGNSTFDLGSRL